MSTIESKVTDDLKDGWGHLPSFPDLVKVVTQAAEKREIPLLSAWLFLPDYSQLYVVVKDLITNLINDDNFTLNQNMKQ